MGDPESENLLRLESEHFARSWKNWAEMREVEEWIQSVAGVLDQGWNEQ